MNSYPAARAPLVSFLTTAHGTEPYIAEVIESATKQTCPDWEMVIVDNGMSEAMAAAVRPHLSDERLRFIRQENRGYLGGVHAAAAIATGRYLCVLDSDDLLTPEFCQRVAQLTSADPRICAVAGGAELFRDPDDGSAPEDYFTSVGRRTTPHPSRQTTLDELFEEGVPFYAGAVRRDVWDALRGYDPSESDVEPDVVLWLRLVAEGHDMRIVPEHLARMRMRPLSESRHPAKIDAFENRLQHSFFVAGAEYGISDDRIRRAGMLRRLRYQQALRQARAALLAGDAEASLGAAKEAFHQQRTLRAALVLVGVRTLPRLLRVVHPMKARAAEWLRGNRFRVAAR